MCVYEHTRALPTASFHSILPLISLSTHVQMKGELDREKAELRPKKKKRGTRSLDDILVWGELVVYASPEDAKSSLDADEADEQYVRLIQIAENTQLRLMLEVGAESCGSDAALYVRVDPTCPIYWIRWSDRKSEADLDIVCDIPHRGNRSTVIKRVQIDINDGKGGVKIRHARLKPTGTSTLSTQRALLVNTSCGRIVGSANFPRLSSSRDHGSGGDLVVEGEEDEIEDEIEDEVEAEAEAEGEEGGIEL